MFDVRPIGFAYSGFGNVDATPVQAALNPDGSARIDLDPRFGPALADLHGFTHAWLLTWLGAEADGNRPLELRPVPFLLQQSPRRIGLFATRGPHRPNPIGLSLVRIERVAPPSMFVRGADFADGTPVLDIKPYVTAFDTPFGGQVRSGWFETVELPHGATPEQLRGGATAKGDDHPCG